MCKVRCTHCGSIYNLENVKTIARYSDCTVFESPCCHRRVDDRTWKPLPDFRKIINETIFDFFMTIKNNRE